MGAGESAAETGETGASVGTGRASAGSSHRVVRDHAVTRGHVGVPGHVVVIGAGIAGLAAAHRLLGMGARVTVLEAAARLGGKLLTGEIAGVRVDLGAESMLARRPEAVALARASGLGEVLVPPATSAAALWTRGALRPMPKGHVMGVPGDPAVLADVLSADGLRRIEQDRTLPRTETGDDVAVGEYVARRLGREVVDRLVDPLLGGVYAGDAYRISMRSAVPQLFEAARAHTSLIEGVREIQRRAAARQQQAGPLFMGIQGGVGRLPLAVADAVRAGGGEIVMGAEVTGLRRIPPAPGSGAGDGSGGTGGAVGIPGADGHTCACAGGWRITLDGRSASGSRPASRSLPASGSRPTSVGLRESAQARPAGPQGASSGAGCGLGASSGSGAGTGSGSTSGSDDHTGGLGQGGGREYGPGPGGRMGPDADRAIGGSRTIDADAVVLAVPAPAAARLLAPESPAAAAELQSVEYASMALVTLAYRRSEAGLPEGSGFLVPAVDGHTIKAATFASQKWSWVADQDPDLLVLRASLGRHGEEEILQRTDTELVDVARGDLRAATGLTGAPVAAVVTRWHQGLPQYPVGHQARVARVREHLAKLPGLAVCGAAYDGVGIPACIASAHAAAGQLGGGPGARDTTAALAGNPVQSLHGGAGE